MKPEDIEKAIHDGIAKALEQQLAPAIAAAVNTSVNGKIDGLRKAVNPLLEAYEAFTGSRRLIFWVGGAIIGIGSFMVAVQQIYQIAFSHVVIK